MEGNSIRIVFAGLLVTFSMLFGCPVYLHGNGLHVALTYHFFHANIFHLAANVLSIWAIFAKDRRYAWCSLIVAYVCATISWYCTSSDVVGISNMIFALLGLRTPSLKDGWWRRRTVIVFLLVTAGMALVPGISAGTHLVSFFLGVLFASFQRILMMIRSDYYRASYNR